MKKIELTRKEVVTLYNNMSTYVIKVGKKNDSLSWMCDNLMTYEPNVEIIEEHAKLLSKKEKELNRVIRKLSNKHAKVYTEGDKKGTFILDDKGNFLHTVEGQDTLNDESDIIYDNYEEEITKLMKEKIEYYIEKASSIPDNLPVEFKNTLELLIPDK